MRTNLRWVIILSLLGGACAGKTPFDPSEIAPIGDKSDAFSDATRIVGELAYGHTGKGTFAARGYDGYSFTAKAGDVVEAYLAATPRGDAADPVVLLYATDGAASPGGVPLAWNDDAGPNRRDAHLDEVVIPEDGSYVLVVAERGHRPVDYHLRLACAGGGCELAFHARQEKPCVMSNLGTQVHQAVLASNPQKMPIPGALVRSDRNVVSMPIWARSRLLYSDPRQAPYPMIYPVLGDLVAAAQYEIDIRASDISLSDPLDEILDGLVRLEGRLRRQGRAGDPAIVRLVADTQEIIAGTPSSYARMLHGAVHALGLDPQLVRFELATWHHLSVHEDHSKIVVIDGAIVHITGQNPHRNANYDVVEHDTAYVVKGELGRSALADFDFSWTNHNTDLWTCSFREDGQVEDCASSDPRPIVHRPEVADPDLGRFGVSADACLPVLYLGKIGSASLFTNEIDHPIGQGFLAAIHNARTLVRIESPNLGDDAVIGGIIDGLMRNPSVRTQIVIPPHRNEMKASLPFAGGTNEERYVTLVDHLLDALYGLCPSSLPPCAPQVQKEPEIAGKLQYRWHPIEGNVPGAQHVKYMSVDHQMVFVGSTNMDTQSFNRARETSIAIDDAEVTRLYDQAVFIPEFEISRKAAATFDDGIVDDDGA